MTDKIHHSPFGFAYSVTATEIPVVTALDVVYQQIDQSKGGIFSSGFEYPGRHSRWDMGFVNPAVEFIGQNRKFRINALNPTGSLVLKCFGSVLNTCSDIDKLTTNENEICGLIRRPAAFFSEEERSRQPSIFSVLRSLCHGFSDVSSELSLFGFYGAFGYDLVLEFEDIKLSHPRKDSDKNCHLYFPLQVRAVDRIKNIAHEYRLTIIRDGVNSDSLSGGGTACPLPTVTQEINIECDHKPGEFAEKVREVIKGTEKGDYFEVVLSQTFSTYCAEKPTTLFNRLVKLNPSPYMFLLNFGDEQLVGSSPEMYVRVSEGRYETCPIAGTIPRGKTALEDADRIRQLMASKKDESELTMCTDVDRNDMARVCIPGSVRVIGRRQLELYSHLIHTVDHLEGTLAENFDGLDAFQTHMWACTVTGAPKPAAIQEIERLEKSPRGWYSGAVGVVSLNGNVNTGIVLRTAHLKDGRASIRAGATLLFGSDPDSEEQETRTKAAAFLAALTVGANNNSQIPDSANQMSLPPIYKKVLLVDYRDSFVHNLAAYIRALGSEVTTVRPGFPLEILEKLKPDLVLLSPGPGVPGDFKMPEFIGKMIERRIPLFGVCLGHQGIGQHFGAELAQLSVPYHGKESLVTHNNDIIFTGVPQCFSAGRYHSLYLRRESIPDCLEIIAESKPQDAGEESIIMAIRHKSLPIAAVQFHPESLMTLKDGVGYTILYNALNNLPLGK